MKSFLITIIIGVAIYCWLSETSRGQKRKKALSPQEEWKSKTLKYVEEVNEFVARGYKEGWEKVGKEPAEPDRKHLVKSLLEAIRKANAQGNLDELRELWPPAQGPLIETLQEKGQEISELCILPDDSLLARVGAYYEEAKTVIIRGDDVTSLPEIGLFGRGPNRRYFALQKAHGVAVIDGWGGPQTSLCPWPTGLEELPAKLKAKPWVKAPVPERIIPFPCGTKVLMIGSCGIYVLSPSGAKRLLPCNEMLIEDAEEFIEGDEHNQLIPYISMAHGAISPDGKQIAIGHQDSAHLVFNNELEKIAHIGNLSSYPHYALFNKSNSKLALNSCHFYNGVTIAVPTNIIDGLITEEYDEDIRTPTVEAHSRIYAGTSTGDNFIVGDAYGYVRAFSDEGRHLWQQMVGSSVGAIDISVDGKTMVVATCAGFISIFKMNAGRQAVHQIGDGNHEEIRRWIFWKDEPKALIW